MARVAHAGEGHEEACCSRPDRLLVVLCPADSACIPAAKDKKLNGAARNSFVKKCEADAKAKCELAATEKKLSGAAKSSNVKKCVRETGPAT